MKISTKMKMLALVAGMLLTGPGNVWAGDGTKASPYTVAELNAQKDALAASGNVVWVNSQETNFYGNYAWETEAKDWITWGGGQYADFHQAIEFDFQNNNGNWPVGEGADFALGNVSTLTMNGVTLTGLQGGSANPVRIMKNASRGICLWLYKGTSVKFNAPEGKAITRIDVTMQSGLFDLAPGNGTVSDNVWTGNASEVTFGPNTNSTRYVWAFAITLADENEETVKPASVDVEAADIAAFNAAEDGKIVRLALKDARVNGYFDLRGVYFVEDATGATVIKGVTLTPATALNGYIVGTKSTDADIDYMNTPAVDLHRRFYLRRCHHHTHRHNDVYRQCLPSGQLWQAGDA